MSENISVSASTGTNVLNTALKAIKFILISYVISIILLALVAVFIVYTDVSESISGPAVKIITLLGAFISAFLTSKSAEAKGWICGAFTGGLNVFLLMVIGMALMGTQIFSMPNTILMLSGSFCGLIGGILGVNLGNN